MSSTKVNHFSHMEIECGPLLNELRRIWDEVGESHEDRNKMLIQLQQECVEVHRRKLDEASKSRAQLWQIIADREADVAAICSVLDEPPVQLKPNGSSLKEVLNGTLAKLEETQKRKSHRWNQFLDVSYKIERISVEIGSTENNSIDESDTSSDLSVKRLEELHRHLHNLMKEKKERLNWFRDHLSTLKSICLVLGMDFQTIVGETHLRLELDDRECPIDLSNNTIETLAKGIDKFRELKVERMLKLQDIATAMLELWNLMDTPPKEQQPFQKFTCNIAASEDEITEPDMLSLSTINHVNNEVLRLEKLKENRMKELVLMKKSKLDELRRRTHIISNTDDEMGFSVEAIESGRIDLSLALEQLESQTAKAKEEAFSRKEILEKVEKWLSTCGEESWLEEYNRDDNRYAAVKGVHLVLKRAEKARMLVSKIPTIVESLVTKTSAWEKEHGIKFTYDGIGLLSMLEDYTLLRQEKEKEYRRQRDQKKLQGQQLAEQEAIYGSKSSPVKPPLPRKVSKTPEESPSVRSNSKSLSATLNSSKKAVEATSFSDGASTDPEFVGHSMKRPSSLTLDPQCGKTTSSKLVWGVYEDKMNMTTKFLSIPRSARSPTTPPRTPPPRTPKGSSKRMQMEKSPDVGKSEEIEHSFEEKRAGVIPRR